MPTTYNIPPTTDVDQIRLRLGDTDVNAALFADGEITAAYALAGNSYDEAVFILQKWGVNRLVKMVDFHIGDAGFSNSQQQKLLVAAIDQSLVNRGGIVPVAPFVGGISIADKEARRSDDDAEPAIFTRDTGDDPQGGLLAGDTVIDPAP